jgi:hypothetical protein
MRHPLSAKKVGATSPTSGGRSVGIVHSQTKATQFTFFSLVQHATYHLKASYPFHKLTMQILVFLFTMSSDWN